VRNQLYLPSEQSTHLDNDSDKSDKLGEDDDRAVLDETDDAQLDEGEVYHTELFRVITRY